MFLKISSGIPLIIMGETGIGKTILVRYLSTLIGGNVFIYNVHAGLTQIQIEEWIGWVLQAFEMSVDQLKESIQNKGFEEKKKEVMKQMIDFKNFEISEEEDKFYKRKIILFFDEINTNENITGVLQDILINRRIKGT